MEGDLEVDGCRFDPRSSHKMAAYITQNDHLLPHLNVVEYLKFAAQLKLGSTVSADDQTATVTDEFISICRFGRFDDLISIE